MKSRHGSVWVITGAMAALGLGGTISCSGKAVRPQAEAAPQAGAKATTTEAGAKAAVTEADSRAPASSIDEERLETTFRSLIESGSPEAHLRHYLGRVVSIFLIADSVVKEFDDELDAAFRSRGEAVSPTRSRVYKKVQGMWLLTVRERIKLSYVYRRLLETEADAARDAARRAAARRVRVEFENYLFRQSGIERIALHDVLTEVNEVRESMALRPRRIADPRSLELLVSKFKKDIGRRAEIEKRRSADIGQEMEALVTEMEAREAEAREAEGRVPQAQNEVVYPSAGKAGNLTGGTFPRGTWALTYDDGPSGKFTPQIFANLDKHRIKATFFWLAQLAETSGGSAIAQQAREAGMGLANHSYTHANLPKMSQARLESEVIGSTSRLAAVYGDKPKFFRCPYGAGLNVTRIRQMIADQGMIHVFWNVDSLDWQDKNPESVFQRVKKQMLIEGRGVVLFHDVHPQSVVASEKVMAWSKDQEIRWVTMQEVTDELNGKTAAPVR